MSRDNADDTARAATRFLAVAGIDRSRVAAWNVIPGWNGTRKVTAAERREGAEELKQAIALFPHLHTVVLVGKQAQKSEKYIRSLGLRIVKSAHPSPIVRASMRETWERIPHLWREAAQQARTSQAMAASA
ncbi:uracil-DNA glycosylase family protein [Paraburkholderia sp. EG285A]|uniref:uracil-DNA glycosylase family protein n=1 Tax=Paraburkholderia sp. EG285A TaxID=3237009 RepID=UPI0034D1889B